VFVLFEILTQKTAFGRFFIGEFPSRQKATDPL